MELTCIVVADAARARFFFYERLAAPPGHVTQSLSEVEDLVNVMGRRRGTRELLAEPYLRDVERLFAIDVVACAARILRDSGARRLVLAAAPHFLGILRKHLHPVTRLNVPVSEAARDITWLTPAQIQDHLADLGLMSGRERLAPAG